MRRDRSFTINSLKKLFLSELISKDLNKSKLNKDTDENPVLERLIGRNKKHKSMKLLSKFYKHNYVYNS